MSATDRSAPGPAQDKTNRDSSQDPRVRALRIAGSMSIAILGTLAYANTFSASFQFDDNVNIVENPFLRWTEITFENLWMTAYQGINDRPVADVSFALNYYLHGFQATGFHAVNLLIHLANGLLVRAFARRTFQRLPHLTPRPNPTADPVSVEWASVFAGLLFTLHPIQTESVTYIVQRMNSLATLFYLSCLLLTIRGRLTAPGITRHGLFALATFCGLLAVGSKPAVILRKPWL